MTTTKLDVRRLTDFLEHLSEWAENCDHLPFVDGAYGDSGTWTIEQELGVVYREAIAELQARAMKTDTQGAAPGWKAPPQAKHAVAPLLNYKAPSGLDCPNRYHAGETIHYPQAEMTKAEYGRINKDYKGTNRLNGHRIRTAMQNHSLVCVFLTDSKVHDVPQHEGEDD